MAHCTHVGEVAFRFRRHDLTWEWSLVTRQEHWSKGLYCLNLSYLLSVMTEERKRTCFNKWWCVLERSAHSQRLLFYLAEACVVFTSVNFRSTNSYRYECTVARLNSTEKAEWRITFPCISLNTTSETFDSDMIDIIIFCMIQSAVAQHLCSLWDITNSAYVHFTLSLK